MATWTRPSTGTGADPESPDEYLAERVFWVPPEARRSELQASARRAAIGTLIDAAMDAIERENRALRPGRDTVLRVRAPDATAIVEFGAFAQPLLDRIALNGVEARTLAALRDTLLPKLTSGELRVRDAERAVDRTA